MTAKTDSDPPAAFTAAAAGAGDADPAGERARFLADLRRRADEAGVATRVASCTTAALDAEDISGDLRRKVAVLSLGNPLEGHGPALAADIDDRTAAVVAVRVCSRTGARYVGHAPYATDTVGDVAGAWSPAYRSPGEFREALVRFIGVLFEQFYDALGLGRPELLVLVSGHGGNGGLAGELEELAAAIGVRQCRYHLSMQLPPGDDSGWRVQHAGAVEHSVAGALGPGCVDPSRLEQCVATMQDDAGLVRALVDHPALGGMAGYYVFGDERFDVVRARYEGVKASVRSWVEQRQIACDAERGRTILDHTVEAIAAEVLQAAEELGLRLPWFA